MALSTAQFAVLSKSLFAPMARKQQTKAAPSELVLQIAGLSREAFEAKQAEIESKKEAKRAERKAAKEAEQAALHNMTVEEWNASVLPTLSATIASKAKANPGLKTGKEKAMLDHKGDSKVKLISEVVTLEEIREEMRRVEEISFVKAVKRYHASLAGTGTITGDKPSETIRSGQDLLGRIRVAKEDMGEALKTINNPNVTEHELRNAQADYNRAEIEHNGAHTKLAALLSHVGHVATLVY